MLAPRPEDIKGGCVKEFMLLLDGIIFGDKAHKKERVHPCNVCDKAFKSLGTPNTHIIWQHNGNVFVCKVCDKKFKTKTASTDKKRFLVSSITTRGAFATFHYGARGRMEKDGSVQLQEEGRHHIPSPIGIVLFSF